MFLRDQEILDFLKLTPKPVEGLDPYPPAIGGRSAIQPSSLDLTIGSVYLPQAEAGKPGSAGNPLVEHNLEPAHTAMIETRETLAMPSTHCAIGFPPSGVSARGLLMTNPGHVDPGYKGPLQFTVINMGRQEFPLRRGDRIVTLLISTIARPAAPYAGPTTRVTTEMLATLSYDFVDVERRARAAAKDEERTTRLYGLAVPAVVGILTIAVTLVAYFSSTDDKLADLKTQVAVLEERLAHLPTTVP